MKVCAIVYICEHIKPTEEVEFEEKTEYKEEKIVLLRKNVQFYLWIIMLWILVYLRRIDISVDCYTFKFHENACKLQCPMYSYITLDILLHCLQAKYIFEFSSSNFQQQ